VRRAGGISCGYLILATTFRGGPAREAAVRLWGFRGPLGAFIAAWGGIAMLTSAPFDDWWHGAYGLDVKIISPPHMVLALGLFSVELGALILVLGRMNRSEGTARRRLGWLYLYLGGMIVVNMLTLTMEYASRVIMHSAIYYRAVALAVPLFLVALSRASDQRWATTKIAGVYTAFWLAINWILPLFPAEPKLGPVYYKVDHLVASYFPILLMAPAALLDLLWPRIAGWKRWQQALAAGTVFLAGVVAVQWPFAEFLMSPASRNWFFFTHEFDYGDRPSSYEMRNLFFAWEKSAAEFWRSMAIALASAALLTWVGMIWGGWLRRLRR